jgi:hypothetical protein
MVVPLRRAAWTADPGLDRVELHADAVARDDEQLVLRHVRDAVLHDRFRGARHHHEKLLLEPGRLDGGDDLGLEDLRDLFDRGRDLARMIPVFGRGDEKMEEILQGEHADEDPLVIDDREAPVVPGRHLAIGLDHRIGRAGRRDLATADVPGAEVDVADQGRPVDSGFLEDPLGARVGMAAAGRDGVGQPGLAKEVGVGERRADRVGVGVLVAHHPGGADGLRGSRGGFSHPGTVRHPGRVSTEKSPLCRG